MVIFFSRLYSSRRVRRQFTSSENAAFWLDRGDRIRTKWKYNNCSDHQTVWKCKIIAKCFGAPSSQWRLLEASWDKNQIYSMETPFFFTKSCDRPPLCAVSRFPQSHCRGRRTGWLQRRLKVALRAHGNPPAPPHLPLDRVLSITGRLWFMKVLDSSRKTNPVTLSPLRRTAAAAATEGRGRSSGSRPPACTPARPLTTVINWASLTKLVKHAAIKLNLL